MWDFNLFLKYIVCFLVVLDNEVYYFRGCRCKCCCLYYVLDFVYVYYRKCVCGEYCNMFNVFEYIVENCLLFIGYINIDGVDIYVDVYCYYVYLIKKFFGEKIF